MKQIWELFHELHRLLDENKDTKLYQEANLLTHQLLDHITYCQAGEQRDACDSVAFFQNAVSSSPFSFGKCGDRVYFKIVNGILYISGDGPMWNFNNASWDSDKDAPFSPWCNMDFHTVIILNGVTTIGVDAFHGAVLSSVILPQSVKTIESAAFFDARIETLILPETLETLEEGCLTGFASVVNTLTVSVNIPNIKPFSLFNRNDSIAQTVYLTGEVPEDLSHLAASCLFDTVGYYPIYYPKHWDTKEASFYEKLLPVFPDADTAFLQKLKKALLPYLV